LLTFLSVAAPINVVIKALPFNFYCIAALVICFIVARKDINIGPMKKAEERRAQVLQSTERTVDTYQKASSPIVAIVPLVVLLACVPTFLFCYGSGKLYIRRCFNSSILGSSGCYGGGFFCCKKSRLKLQGI
jgi:hypothetical protein